MGRRIDPDRLAVARAVIGTACLRDFAARIIAHVSGGGVLDDDALASIRAECIREVKNADPAGLSVEQEAEVVGQVVEHADKLIDSAIREGRKR